MECDMNSEAANYQDILTRAFNHHYNSETDVWTQDIGMRILPLLVKGKLRFGPETRLLDIGCGSGLDVGVYSPQCLSVEGVDLFAHPEWPKSEAVFKNVEFKHGDFLNLALEGDYHIIVDNGCFHHQQQSDWPAYLVKIGRLLRETGTLVLSTFCDDKRTSYTDDNQRIHHYFTDEEFAGLLQENHFKIVDNLYIYRPRYDNYYRISFCKKSICI